MAQGSDTLNLLTSVLGVFTLIDNGNLLWLIRDWSIDSLGAKTLLEQLWESGLFVPDTLEFLNVNWLRVRLKGTLDQWVAEAGRESVLPDCLGGAD